MPEPREKIYDESWALTMPKEDLTSKDYNSLNPR